MYTFMSDHIFRESCSSRCLQDSYDWVLQKPHYVIGGAGSMVLDGLHSDHMFKNAITKFIFESNFFANRDFPALETPTNYRFHQALLNEFYNEVSKHQNLIDAYHFWGMANNSNDINKMYDYVRATPFKAVIMDYYNKNFRAGYLPYIIPVDTHPSPLGHEAMFTTLDWRLKKDHPEIFGSFSSAK